MVKSRFAYNDGVKLAYTRHRRLAYWRPWLVLIQGVGFDGAGWQPVLRRLRRHFRLVVVDNRGVGRSDSPTGWYSVTTMVDDVLSVLGAEGIGRAHVLGVSLGGMVAQELAISHPDKVDRLVLVSTTSGWPLTYPVPTPTTRMLALAPVLPKETALRRHVENMVSERSAAEQPDLVRHMVDYLRSREHDPRSSRRQIAAGATFLGRMRQRRISADTLVMHGTADSVADPRNAGRLAEQIPGAELVMFPGAGHLLCWEDPDRFSEVVTSFLRRPPSLVPVGGVTVGGVTTGGVTTSGVTTGGVTAGGAG